jgi:O-antigen/teichoic acid export membrane protein
MEFERTTLVVFLSKILSTAIGFLGTIYYARELGPAIIGTFFLMQSLIGILAIPGDLGVQKAVEKRISGKGDKNKLLTASGILLLLSFSVVFVISWSFMPDINDYLGVPVFGELIVMLFVTMISDLFISALRGELKIIHSAGIQAFQSVTILSVSIVLIIHDLEIYALILGIVIGKASSTLIAMYLSNIRIQQPQTKHYRSIFRFSKYNMFLRTSGQIYGWADVIIIGYFLSNSIVGIYEISWRISTLGILASAAISRVIFPNFSKLHKEGDLHTISDYIPKTIVYSLILPIGMFFGSLVLSDKVLQIIYGEAFQAGALVLVILTAERVIHSFYSTFYDIVLAFDHPRKAFHISTASLLINIILNLLLVPLYGMEGAAIAVFVAYVVSATLYFRETRKYMGFSIPMLTILGMIISGTIMALVVHGIRSQIVIDSIPLLLITIIMGGVIYGFIILLLVYCDKAFKFNQLQNYED